MDKSNFKKVTIQIIDLLEGGYYHPDMLADGRVRDERYRNSGETMFGLDRKAGGNLNTTPAGIKFWAEIDKLNARENWDWNYKGGTFAPKLKDLLTDVMFVHYTDLSNRYLSEKSRKIVESDNRLLFHFIYGAWNGPVWFQKFANDINNAVDKGTKNTDKLTEIALNSRLNADSSLIRQGGAKIQNYFAQGKIGSSAKSGNGLIYASIVLFLLAGTFFYLQHKKIIKI